MEFARCFSYAVNMHKTLLDKFMALPLFFKLIGIGSFITMFSVFLPWYQDLDAFNTGDKFIGLSGPLYLLGFLILLLAICSFGLFAMRFFGKSLPRLPMSEPHSHIFTGAFSLFLLLITNSIYFHTKFGVNITMKEARFGMIIAFFGTLLTLIGGLLQNKNRGVSFEVGGSISPLIDVEHDRTKRGIDNNTIVEKTTETISVSFEKNDAEAKIDQNNLF